ncbi:MAG: DUF4838 domain-containing protein [Candidatus Omnitrophota bacterium]
MKTYKCCLMRLAGLWLFILPLRLMTADVPLVLVRDGNPTVSIVVAKEPSRSAAFGAIELQYHIQKITGTDLPIVTDDVPVSGPVVLVGESTLTRQRGLKSADFKPQEYLIRFEPNVLILMGRDKPDGIANWRDPAVSRGNAPSYQDYEDNGSNYAVFDFLERYCGVRWYAPTELGMVYPTTKTLEVRGKDVRRSPAFEFRLTPMGLYYYTSSTMTANLWNHATANDIGLWVRRLRLGGKMYAGNHSFYGYYDRFWKKNPQNPGVFEEEHSEYFAQGYDGKPPQLCYTNPALIKQVVQDARDYFDGKGAKYWACVGENYFCLEPMDSSDYCKCDTCQAFLNKDEVNNQQFSNGKCSNYIFTFVNKVARELKKTHPDKYVSVLAYANKAHYPTNVRLEPNVMVQMCLHTRNWWCPAMERSDMAVYKPWVKKEKGRPLALWLYYLFPEFIANGQGFHCFPGFFAHTQARQFKMFHKDGILGTYSDAWATGEQIDAYVMFKMLDDPDQDVDQLLHEFFTRYYGPAAGKYLEQFYRRVEEIYTNPANYPEEVQKEDKTFHQTEEIAWGYLGTAERMAELGKLVEQAGAAVQTDAEKQRFALFEQGIWKYMSEGRKKYVAKLPFKAEVEALKKSLPPSGRIPKADGTIANGDCTRVDWSKAAVIKIYRSVQGYPTDRTVRALMVHDGRFLYLHLEDATDATKLVDGGVFSGDHWELFFAAQRGKETFLAARENPYRQIGISASEKFEAYLWGESGGWNSGVKITSTKTPESWIMNLAFPLDKLTARGVKSEGKLYFNLIRGSSQGADPLAWSPTFSDNFHAPERFGELTLE